MKINALCFVLLLFFPSLIISVNGQPVLTPALEEVVSQKEEEEFISVNIKLAKQYDDELLYQKARSILNPEKRRAFVIYELKKFNKTHQKELLSFLNKQKAKGRVREINPLWITNLINSEVKVSVIQELINRKDIIQLDYNKIEEVLTESHVSPQSKKLGNNTLENPDLAWNISMIKADQVWASGYTGEGVLAAVLDTGVNYHHLDIQDNMWEHPDYPNHGYNFAENNFDPMDYHGHGSHCAGTLAGNGTAGTATGVAPEASVMAVKVLNDQGGGTEVWVWQGIQFAIENGAQIMSISLGWGHNHGPDRSTWRQIMNNALNAGVIAAVSAGNRGTSGPPPPNQVGTPGDVPPPWLHPDQLVQEGISAVVSVGSVTNSGALSPFSSNGPVTWENIPPFNDYEYNPGMGLIRPDVVAPGSEILSLSHSDNSSYTIKSGTSMAAPAVAGLFALMISKNPGLIPEKISQIVEQSAFSSADNKNNAIGSGLIDALETIQQTPLPAIYYSHHELDDSQGNDNGNINPGELISVNVTLENTTQESIENVWTVLEIDSEYISLIDGITDTVDFQPGEIKTLNNAFAFQTAENIPNNYSVIFKLVARSQQDTGSVWLSSFTEEAHAPELTFSNPRIDNKQDNSLIIDPGQTSEMKITLSNTGNFISDSVEAFLESDGQWLNIISPAAPPMTPLAPGDSIELPFVINAFHDAPFGSVAPLYFNAFSGLYEFDYSREILIGQVPYSIYTEKDIPSTFAENVNTDSSSLEPGQISVNIPEESIIVGVDVSYSMKSHSGAYMSDQRSFIRCVSEGGETEPQVYSGNNDTPGTQQYERLGLDIANGVEGGGEIEFELHAFRIWGGEGSNTNYVYVPVNTWEIWVHHEFPAYEVTFLVKNQLDDLVENATIKVGNTTRETNDSGEAVFFLPKGILYFDASAANHEPLLIQPIEVTEQNNFVEVSMLRQFKANFSIKDVHGNEIPNAVIVFNGESFAPGEYTIEGLGNGTYNYEIHAEGFLSKEGEIVINNEDVEVEAIMTPFYRVTFVISDEWGNEVDNAFITLNGVPFEQGEYIIENLIPGAYSFLVEAAHYQDYTGNFEVVDQNAELEVVLQSDGTFVFDLSEKEMTVFPNPANSFVYVKAEDLIWKVRMLDITGRLLYSSEPAKKSYKLNVSGFENGVYFIQVITPKGSVTRKVQISKK